MNKQTFGNIIQSCVLSLVILYYLQGVIYPIGNIVAKISFAFLILISGIYVVKVLALKNKGVFVKLLITFIFIQSMYFLFYRAPDSGLIFPSCYYEQFKLILGGLIPFFVYYYLALKGRLSANILNWFSVFLFLALLGKYFYELRSIIDISNDSENVVNNAAYYFVNLAPLLLLIARKKPIISIICVVISLGLVISATKRGALVCYVMFMCIYSYFLFKRQRKFLDTRLKKTVASILVLTLVVTIGYFGFQALSANEYFLRRLSDGVSNTSGRDSIFASIFEAWMNGNVIEILFGHGFAASVQFAGNYAHNDWLELLAMGGLSIVMIYLLIFLSLVGLIRSKSMNKEDSIVLFSVLSMWGAQSLFSMGYCDFSWNIYALVLGVVIGGIERSKRLNYE
ncbi:hypothetical protein [Marinifilum fragile]|uniref:hypothetical protein n=1 Tax=Marinifilum fragile TaxID=570161 RepID=UPI0006D22619|nr:hypothetical protein [Marinifilum fragile]